MLILLCSPDHVQKKKSSNVIIVPKQTAACHNAAQVILYISNTHYYSAIQTSPPLLQHAINKYHSKYFPYHLKTFTFCFCDTWKAHGVAGSSKLSHRHTAPHHPRISGPCNNTAWGLAASERRWGPQAGSSQLLSVTQQHNPAAKMPNSSTLGCTNAQY